MTVSQQTHQLQQPQIELPDTISSGNSKLVYYFIKTHNGVTVDELSEQLKLKKLTIYSILRRFTSEDYVTKTDREYF